MVQGKSIQHVNQNMGKCFIPGEIRGYFNNLTEKVTKEPELIRKQLLPITAIDKEKYIQFPVAIFQYGLGAYDLFIMTKEEKYLNQFRLCIDWAINNQNENGSWNNFINTYPDNPFGAMCQGEGASLLVRGFIHYNDDKYITAAKKAIDFMLIPTDDGGTTKYVGDDIIFLEYTNLPAVLNGWIFSIFGLYDFNLIYNRPEYSDAIQKALVTLKKYLHSFDTGYWSLYDIDKKIASPFYHSLHIAQLEALYIIDDDEIFKHYWMKFINYKKNIFFYLKSFIIKAYQKLTE
jgi:hypothetical protein